MPLMPEKFENVSVVVKANVYFDGRVVSHTVLFPDGSRKTLGLLYAGTFEFKTASPERMDIIAGDCRVRQVGETDWTAYAAGTFFRVAGNSSFEIAVAAGLTEYVCSFE